MRSSHSTWQWSAVLLLLTGIGTLPAQAQQPPISDSPKDQAKPAETNPFAGASHSKHGAAFDEGPRQQAKLLRGFGSVHFPVTTKSPLAQKFFDQGVNLLYSFSYYEAERSFRQVILLDPDCAMAYWGMAEADGSRSKDFLKLAQAKKDKVSDRERRYIDAAAIEYREGGDEKSKRADLVHALEQLVFAYPDDLEAKVRLAWALPRESEKTSERMGIEAMLREVLAKNPNHPGAHHFRIHLWDGPNAKNALDSCAAYPRLAPAIGHAQHMPGHIYAQLGMWDQAAYAMDAAARVERRYFYDQGQMPYDSWNYAHDQHYLIANLGYLGRITEGTRLANELLTVPRDPKANTLTLDGTEVGQGRFALMRMRIRGERWDEILNDKNPGWSDSTENKGWKSYTLGMAYLGKENRDEARKQLKAIEDLKSKADEMECARLELTGRLAVADGDIPKGLDALRKAADIEKAKFAYSDPSRYPRPLYESLAWGYLRAQKWAEAEVTLREGLRREPGNGFALCLLLETLTAAGKTSDIPAVDEQLRVAWKHADPDLPALRRVQVATTRAGVACAVNTKGFTVPYRPSSELERLGPARWQPFPASNVAFTDPNGKSVRVADYKGKNLLLVFYLGGGCTECMKQLEGFGKEKAAFDALDTRIVAVSPGLPDMLKNFLAATPNYPLTLVCDPKNEAAKKFKAYDDFEDLHLHAVVLLDKNGRVWWQRSGGEPFTDFAFLKSEIARMNALR